eukprot:5434293-Alexandrium_andersonii.AAC.1
MPQLALRLMRQPALPLHARRSAPVRRRAPPGVFKMGREREPGGGNDRPAPDRHPRRDGIAPAMENKRRRRSCRECNGLRCSCCRG